MGRYKKRGIGGGKPIDRVAWRGIRPSAWDAGGNPKGSKNKTKKRCKIKPDELASKLAGWPRKVGLSGFYGKHPLGGQASIQKTPIKCMDIKGNLDKRVICPECGGWFPPGRFRKHVLSRHPSKVKASWMNDF